MDAGRKRRRVGTLGDAGSARNGYGYIELGDQSSDIASIVKKFPKNLIWQARKKWLMLAIIWNPVFFISHLIMCRLPKA